MSPGFWRAALAAAAVLAVSGVAYVRTTAGNACLYWGTRYVSYLVNDFSGAYGAQDVCAATTDPAAAQAAVRASFDAWTAAGGQLNCTDLQLVNEGGTAGFTTTTHTGYDKQNIVVFRAGPCTSLAPPGNPCFASHTCGDTYNCWDTNAPNHGDPKIIALTTTTYSTRTGQIFDADVELNAAYPPLGTGLPTSAGYYFTCGPVSPICSTLGQANCVYWDVQDTVTHEAGHFIGFAHNTDPASTMYPTAPLGYTGKRTLATEDIQGVCDVYPTGKPPLTCGTNSSGCGCGTTGAEGVLGLAAVVLAWRRRSGAVTAAVGGSWGYRSRSGGPVASEPPPRGGEPASPMRGLLWRDGRAADKSVERVANRVLASAARLRRAMSAPGPGGSSCRVAEAR